MKASNEHASINCSQVTDKAQKKASEHRSGAYHCHWATVELSTVRMPWPKEGSRYAELRRHNAEIQYALHQ